MVIVGVLIGSMVVRAIATGHGTPLASHTSMEMGNRFTAAAAEPAHRLVYLTQASFETARRFNRAREITAEPGRCDPRLCRILLHPTEREISHFQQELAHTVRPPIRDVFEPSRGLLELDQLPDPLASPPTERKPYAPDPIGKPAAPREVPPDVAEVLHMINYFQITPEGSLIDLLV